MVLVIACIAAPSTQIAYVRDHFLFALPCSRSGRPLQNGKPVRVCKIPKDAWIQWTPSGEIAIANDLGDSQEIDLVAPRAHSKTRKLAAGFDPAFSPDGSFVAYTVWRSLGGYLNTTDVWVKDLRTGKASIFAKNADNFCWSPKGDRIAYSEVIDKPGNQRAGVYTFPGLKPLCSTLMGNPTEFSVSPDDSLFAAESHLSRPLTGHCILEISSGKTLALHCPERFAPPVLDDWSPDGKSAIFEWRIQDPNNDGNWTEQTEAVVDLQSGRVLSKIRGSNGRFSPDGTAILYLSSVHGAGELRWKPLRPGSRPVLLGRGVDQFAVRG